MRRKISVLENGININQLRPGDRKAYEKLFTEWYVPLCNYALGILRDSDEAEDIVQKTFCKLWDQRNEIEIKSSVKSYLYRMVHNDCLNKIKQQKIRFEHNKNIAYERNDTINNAESNILHSELQQQLQQAIDRLPPRCREVFTMSRFQYRSYAEIAHELRITTNTVETQIVKALRILRHELKDYLPLLLMFLLKSK